MNSEFKPKLQLIPNKDRTLLQAAVRAAAVEAKVGGEVVPRVLRVAITCRAHKMATGFVVMSSIYMMCTGYVYQ
jgi:hypothetical protein